MLSFLSFQISNRSLLHEYFSLCYVLYTYRLIFLFSWFSEEVSSCEFEGNTTDSSSVRCMYDVMSMMCMLDFIHTGNRTTSRTDIVCIRLEYVVVLVIRIRVCNTSSYHDKQLERGMGLDGKSCGVVGWERRLEICERSLL